MRASVFKEGERAWHDGKGFIANPFHVWHEEENYMSWSQGWWSVQDKAEAKDHEILQKEYDLQIERELKEKEKKEKMKTKKGRSELAGQKTLF